MSSYRIHGNETTKERKSKMHGIKGMIIIMLLMLAMSLVFSAQDSSVLLEEAIYTEETLGNLSKAITIYKQIVSTADISRITGATALYRLGMCYRKSGNEADALATFSALAKLYPEQKELIGKSYALNLTPAPWADGEIMRLTQKRIGTEFVSGLGTYSVESIREGGKSAWDFRYYFGWGTPIYYSVTSADAGTMIPIANRTLSNQTDLEARYGANKIEVLNINDSSQPPKQIPSTGTVYDAWQIVPLLRRLPLREGFQTVIPMFAASSGSFANVKFEVVARETITVPAGSFDCHKIAMIADDNAPADQVFWISADDHAYLVKTYINGNNLFELKSVEVVGKNQPISFDAPQLGISLSASRQWYLSDSPEQRLMLSAPELKSSLNVMTIPNNPTGGYAANPGINGTKIIVNSPFNSISASGAAASQNRESVAIAGLTGERYIVNTTDSISGKPIVNYIYSLTGPSKRYNFAFQTDKDIFDKMKPEFESIMSSIRIQ
jgi:hypothetical protein